MPELQQVILRGTRASQPAATGLPGVIYYVTDEGVTERSTGSAWESYSGVVVQVVNTQTGAVATGTTQIPLDDTIPQITEGTEYMTLTITPKSATNKLLIQVQAFVTSSLANWITMALFQDATANALAAITFHNPTNTAGGFRTLTHYMDAGTTSATTFRVRIGQDGAATTVTFNGQSGGRIFGGVMASSITIMEIVP